MGPVDKPCPVPYTPYVIRSHCRRLGALFLLTAFIGGGFGLSDLDAVLFHSSPHGARADVAHFDQPGGCGAHAERCVLAVATARVASVVPVPVKIRLSPVAIRPLAWTAPVRPSSFRGSHQHSRAPPRASVR